MPAGERAGRHPNHEVRCWLTTSRPRLEVISALPHVQSGKPEMLFVHGAWHGAWCWARFLNHFAAQGFPAHALSVRDHAGSERRPRMLGAFLRDYINDILTVAKELQLKNAVLVGHSLGGYWAQRVINKTDAFTQLVLVASVPPSGLLSTTVQFMKNHPLQYLQSLQGTLAPAVETPQLADASLFSGRLSSEELRRYFKLLTRDESYLAYLESHTPLRVRQNENVRVMVVEAGKDGIIPPGSAAATARAYNAAYVTLERAAHDIMLDPEWEKAAALIERWLEAGRAERPFFDNGRH